jgi:hypothetical protein
MGTRREAAAQEPQKASQECCLFALPVDGWMLPTLEKHAYSLNSRHFFLAAYLCLLLGTPLLRALSFCILWLANVFFFTV